MAVWLSGVALVLSGCASLPTVSPKTEPVPAATKVRVALEGALDGDGYRVHKRAVVESDEEQNVTTLRVWVSRLDDGYSRTPNLRITFPQTGLVCGTNRLYLWSTSSGSEMTVVCTRYLSEAVLARLDTGQVESGY